ncbi:hypothetical protein [Streptacidiphilus sp. PAMC 29251]
MSDRAPGWCVHCTEHTWRGIVLATIERNSGAPYDVVIHEACQEPRREVVKLQLSMIPIDPPERAPRGSEGDPR